LSRSDVSDFEKFMLVFLYADLKGKEYISYIPKLIKYTKRSYIRDMSLLKIVSYYFMRSNNKSLDHFYENMLGEIIVNSKGLKKELKGREIKRFRAKKSIKILNEQRATKGEESAE